MYKEIIKIEAREIKEENKKSKRLTKKPSNWSVE
jgi:hypothetical protein